MFLLVPGLSDFAAIVGSKSTILLLASAFLSPFTSMISWLAWIVSGFVGGLISGRILAPFLSTLSLGWLVFYIVGREQLNILLGFIGGTILIQVIILNTFIASLAFGFGGWIGQAIRGPKS